MGNFVMNFTLQNGLLMYFELAKNQLIVANVRMLKVGLCVHLRLHE